jgi:HSP20 family protein
MFPVPWRSNTGNVSTERAQPLDQFRREFDMLFDRFFGGSLAPFDAEIGQMRWWDFSMDDRGNEVVVKAELPGFEEKDLDVQLNDNLLTIRAEKQEENGQEQRYGSFRRTVTLPFGTDPDKVTATYRNGVLEMHVPKTEQAQGRRIPIKGQQPVSGSAKGQSETARPRAARRGRLDRCSRSGRK